MLRRTVRRSASALAPRPASCIAPTCTRGRAFGSTGGAGGSAGGGGGVGAALGAALGSAEAITLGAALGSADGAADAVAEACAGAGVCAEAHAATPTEVAAVAAKSRANEVTANARRELPRDKSEREPSTRSFPISGEHDAWGHA